MHSGTPRNAKQRTQPSTTKTTKAAPYKIEPKRLQQMRRDRRVPVKMRPRGEPMRLLESCACKCAQAPASVSTQSPTSIASPTPSPTRPLNQPATHPPMRSRARTQQDNQARSITHEPAHRAHTQTNTALRLSSSNTSLLASYRTNSPAGAAASGLPDRDLLEESKDSEGPQEAEDGHACTKRG
jgi:hypothetical protein